MPQYKGSFFWKNLIILAFVVFCLFSPSLCFSSQQIEKTPLVISIAKNYSPFSVISPTSEPTGLLVEMWQLWSQETGMPVTFLADDWSSSIHNIRNGKADVHSGLFANDQRAEWMAFSQPIHEIKTSLFFRSEKEAGLDLKQMAGKKVGTIHGTYQERYLIDNFKDLLLFSYPDGRALILALLKGEVDAILNENVLVEADLASFGIRGLLKQGTQIAISNHVVASVRKDRQELLPVINEGFGQLPLGRMAKLEKLWLPNPVDRYYERLLLAKEFTPKENDWIRKNPAVTVAVTKSFSRVGVLESDGSYIGLNPDLLSLLSERTGLEFVPIFKSKWSDVVKGVMSGETDIALSLSRTPEREKEVLFTPPYAFVPQVAIVKQDYNEIAKWTDLDGKRVAVVKGAAIIEDLKKVIGETGELILTHQLADSLDRVSNGEANACVAGLISFHRALKARSVKDLKIAARYVTEGGTFRIGIHKSKPMLAKILDKGLKRIKHQELIDIRDRWLTIEEAEGPELTAEESAWIKQLKSPLVVGVEMDWPPFDFVKDGKPTGYSNDLVRLAADKVGLTLTFVSGFTWAELVDKFKKGDIDLLPAVYKTPAREKEMALTRSYTSNPTVLIGHEKKPDIRSFEDLVGKKLAVVEGFSINKLIEEKHPGIEQFPVNSVLEALKAVSLEKADAFVGSLGVISHILKKNLVPDIRVVDEVSLEDPEATHLHMATLKEHAVLNDIIQKGLDAISEEELNELRVTWLGLGLIQGQRPRLKLTREEKAWIKENPDIKVASTPDWPPFEYVDSSGNYLGITADILRLVAERAGLKIDIVLRPWSENRLKLKSGELVLCPGLRETPDRHEYLLFTTPFITSQDAIWVKKGTKGIASVKDFPGKTIAVEKGYFQQEYLERNQPDTKLLLTSSTLESLKAVSMGKADAYMGTLAVGAFFIEQHMLSNLEIVGYYEDHLFKLSMGVHDSQPLLRDILQKGLDTISDKEIHDVKQKYMASDAPKNLYLNKEEQQWLEAHKNIRLGVDPSWFPFEGVGSDGRYMGIVSEYVNWLNKKLDVSMAPVEGLTWKEVISEAKAGGVDVLPGVGVTPSRKEYLNFTQSYLRIPIVLVTREDMPFVSGLEGLAGKRLAIIANAPMGEKVRAEHPELRYLETKSLVEALQAVANGDADATLGNNASLTYYVRRDDIKGLKVVAVLPQTLDLSFGVRTDWTPFVSILNKALAAIPKTDHRSFQDRWVNIQVQSRIDWTTVLSISFTILLVAGTILAIIWRANRKLAHEVHERTMAEQKMRAMSEAVHDALVMIDAKARIMYWNHAAESMFDLSASEAMGCDLHALIIPEKLRERARLGLEGFAQDGQGPVVGRLQEVNAVGSDGRLFPAEVAVSGFKVREEWHAVGTIRDISDRKAAEEELLKKEGRLRNYFATSQIGVAICHPTDGWIEVNDRALKMFGYTFDELKQVSWMELTHPEDLEADMSQYNQLLAGELDRYTMDKRFIRKDGSTLYTNLGISCTRDRKNEVEMVLASYVDITARKLAELALQENEAKYRELVENAASIIIKLDPEGRVTFFNEFAQSFFGYSAKEVLGRSILDSIVPEQDAQGQNMSGLIADIVRNPDSYEKNENENVCKNGQKVWISWTNKAVFDDDKKTLVELLCIGTDITERKKAEIERDEAFQVITSSIKYASRIQRAVLPPIDLLYEATSSFFILWKPRDVVGGDIYWCHHWGKGMAVILADCTGHGVPGAFMTLISSGALDLALLEVPEGDSAGLISKMHRLIQIVLGQDRKESLADDGLELGVCYIPPDKKGLVFAGAGFPLFIAENGDVSMIKGDRKGIGYRGTPTNTAYTNHMVENKKGRTFYMSSDGIFDQIGGPKRRGFGKKRFKRKIASIQGIPLSDQDHEIYKILNDYQGDEKRRDDVSVVGFRL